MDFALIFMILDSDTIPQDEFWGPESWILGPWVSKAPLGGAVEGFRWHFEGLCPPKVLKKPWVFAVFQKHNINILFLLDTRNHHENRAVAYTRAQFSILNASNK